MDLRDRPKSLKQKEKIMTTLTTTQKTVLTEAFENLCVARIQKDEATIKKVNAEMRDFVSTIEQTDEIMKEVMELKNSVWMKGARNNA